MPDLKPRVVSFSETGAKYQSLLKNVADTVSLKSGFVCLPPGQSVGAHVTEGREEVIILLEGQAKISCEGNAPISAGKNSVVYIPPEMRHDVENTGSGVLQYVYVVALLAPKN